MMDTVFAFGLGIGTRNARGSWLEVFYPQPLPQAPAAIAEVLSRICGASEAEAVVSIEAFETDALAGELHSIGLPEQADIALRMRDAKAPLLATLLRADRPPQSVPEAYLKLHLLSHRHCKPHEIALDGLFALLPNVAWTNEGAIDIAELAARRLEARLHGRTLDVHSVDKFPRMSDYVVPSGVRIADTARVRLGAYLGEGTTVMHEGFINFNAGSEGPGMIEGRISAGVFVGAGSDLGGGCSTMGTLSGGNRSIISVGKQCLIGANAGIGISLGDRCTVEAGLYVTAGSRVKLIDRDGAPDRTVVARELSGGSDLLFRRNSLSGAIECLGNRSSIALNDALHANN